jgi:hypothetical protein
MQSRMIEGGEGGMPVVFVHGVTVRRERFEALLPQVCDGLNRSGLPVEGFFWGDLASALRFDGASIPGFLRGARALPDVDLARVAAPERGRVMPLLLDDPYLELIALKDATDFDPAGRGFRPPPAGVAARNRALAGARAPVLTGLTADAALQAAVGKPVAAPQLDPVVKTAFDHAGRADQTLTVVDLLDPLVRALTAALYRLIVEPAGSLDTGFAWNATEQRVQEILQEQLGGQRGWVGDRIKGAAFVATTAAMRLGLRRRLMESLSIFLGDVFVYLAQRAAILQRLEDTVAAAIQADPGPLWLVGHSLGGIICYDYCAGTNRAVERLVTVGSQVGLFGELGALSDGAGAAGAKLATPAVVGRWLNIFDQDDMLSFLAEPVFTRVTDREVKTGAPFPVSHGEYWNRSEVYTICTAP